jgi:hypothetical protein
MWQVAKSLTSGELFLLKLVFDEQTKYNKGDNSYSGWENHMATAGGHSVKGLIGIHEKRLTDFGLLTPRLWGDLSGINPANARLTDFGLSFCTNVETYRLAMKEAAAQ